MVESITGSATMRATQIEEARMRDCQAAGMWSCGPPEQRVPLDHPLRPIPGIVDTSLTDPGSRSRPGSCLRTLLLQVLCSTCREWLLMEQQELLFRWFVWLNMDDPIRDPDV